MTSYTLSQNSFAGGEISPALWGRTDWERYAVSLKTCLNFMVMPYGGLKNRPGTKFECAVQDSSVSGRLIPFSYSTTQTYVLEMGDKCCRILKNGALLGTGNEISDLSAYAAGTTYAAGDYVASGGLAYVSRVASNTGHTPASSPTYWLPVVTNADGEVVITLITPWAVADLPLLKYTQSADVLTICHPSYVPQQISRVAETAWTVAAFAAYAGPFDDVNDNTSVTIYASAVSGSVTLTGSGSPFASTDVGKMIYLEQQTAGRAWLAGESISAAGVIRRANGKYWSSLASGTCGSNRPGEDLPKHKDKWDDGGVNWAYLHPGFGWATITAYTDANTVAATVVSRIPDGCVGSGNTTYKWAKGAWNSVNGYPGCTTYHQQRHVFGGSPGFPQHIWLSRTGDYVHFGKSSPLLDDDVLIYPLSSRQVNSVRHITALGRALIGFTSDSIWAIRGSDNQGVLTPTTVQADPQGFLGASDVAPLSIGNALVYVQDKGQAIHDLAYSYVDDAFGGEDLSLFANHLVEGYEVVDWCYQCVPYGIIWVVRSDGALLGLTYNQKQKVIAWHQHDIGGDVEACCCVSEGNEDVVYLLVKRTINSATVRYIERLASRQFDSIEDAFFVDCGLSYDGWNTGSTTITLSGGTTYGYGEEIDITASAALFAYPATTDVGDEIVYVDDGIRYAIRITSTSSTTAAKGIPSKTIPAAYRSARADWGFARSTMAGLSHLEGQTVAILNDGNVEPQNTVASGSVTLSVPGVVVHVGLPIVADMETLDLSISGTETIRDKNKTVNKVGWQVENSRGLWFGQDFTNMVEWKQRYDETMDEPIQLYTGFFEEVIPASTGKTVTICARQSDPVPVSILAVMPRVDIGGA